MAILAYDDVMLREPRLLVPGLQPLGPVRVDRSHPFGKDCQVFFCASQGPVNLVGRQRAVTNTSIPLVSNEKGNLVFDASVHSGYVPISGVTLPFVLAVRVKFDSLPSSVCDRICHLTKDSGLTTIAGFQVLPGGKLGGQNYDGTNNLIANLSISVGVVYDCFFLITGSALNVAVNGVQDAGVAADWTAGPNRFSFFDADWSAGSEYLDGKVEWMGYWRGEEFWKQHMTSSPFRLSPYEMLIPA